MQVKIGWSLALCGVVSVGAMAAAARPDGSFKLVPANGMAKIGYYMPQRLMLAAEKPAQVKKEPAYANKPLYGVLHFGPAEKNEVVLVLDEASDATSAKLYVDANGDGDLTNDPAVTWNRRAQKVTNPQTKAVSESILFMGSQAVVPVGASDKTPLSISIYRFGPETAKQRGLPVDMVLYYRDYAREGEVTVDGKTYKAVLSDERASGRFDQLEHGDKEPARVNLLIDRDGDGRFGKGEQFDLSKPFNLGGESWEVGKIAADGSSLTLKVSPTKVAETKLPPSFGAGKPALAFTKPAIGGKTVSFPADYRGKMVMLDFWATWCGPCIGEIPGLVKTYDKYHEKGFDVLGITLDQANAEQKVVSFTTEHKMPWPQIYDGKYWQAEIAQMYGIEAIPAAFLVDGNTGKIVASGNQLRGELLDGTVAKALAAQTK